MTLVSYLGGWLPQHSILSGKEQGGCVPIKLGTIHSRDNDEIASGARCQGHSQQCLCDVLNIIYQQIQGMFDVY